MTCQSLIGPQDSLRENKLHHGNVPDPSPPSTQMTVGCGMVWLARLAHLWNGCSIRPPRQVLKIQTDASLMGWGACCQGRRSRRSLVAGGNTAPYQLPRAASDISGNPNLCRGEQRPHHPCPDRQQVSNDLREQERRHALCLPDAVGKDSVVMVHGEIDQPGSRTHIGTREHNSRRRVEEASGQMGLEAMPCNIPTDQLDLGSSDSGSICIQDHNSAGEVLQLEAGPLAAGTDAFRQQWVGRTFANPP